MIVVLNYYFSGKHEVESRAKIAAQVWDDHGLLSYNYHY